MKHLLFAILLFQGLASIYSQDIQIKSLKAYTGTESSLPVVIPEEQLVIEFDVQYDFRPDLNIVFRYCDRNWKPYDNLFLQNNGQNIAYNIESSGLSVNVEEAKYHVKEFYPDSKGFVSFPFSGKWRFLYYRCN